MSSLETYLLYGTHANELIGPAIEEVFQEEPIPGIRTFNAHPEAWEVGRGKLRFLGYKELMGHYPGDASSPDPESRAAFANMQKLKMVVGDPRVSVVDIHNTKEPDLEAFYTGRWVSKASLAAGFLLGFTRFLVDTHSPFYKSIPNSSTLDVSVPDGNYKGRAQKLHGKLRDLAMMSVVELEELYEVVKPDMHFCQKTIIFSQDKTGALAEYMDEVESIPLQPAFSPLEISNELRRRVGIPLDVPLAYGSWGHRNMGPQLPPSLGSFEGRRRQLAVSEVFIQIGPPEDRGSWLEYTGLFPGLPT